MILFRKISAIFCCLLLIFVAKIQRFLILCSRVPLQIQFPAGWSYHFLRLYDGKIRMDELQPGEGAVLTVKYKAEEPGSFWRTITVYGNIPEKSFTLDFWGTVGK